MLFIGISGGLCAQVNPILFEMITLSLKDSSLIQFNNAKIKFQQENYQEAAMGFEKVLKKNPTLSELYYVAGVCYTNDADNYSKAIQYINKAQLKANNIDGYFFNQGFALEKCDSVNKAIEKYHIALSLEEKKGIKKSALIDEINYRIKRCETVIEYKNKKNIVKITNLGKPINSGGWEYCPLVPSNEAVMIFTYRGPKSKGGKQVLKGKIPDGSENIELFYEDVFISKKINDTLWSEPKPIDNLNTTLHDAAVSLSFEGSQLFVYRNLGDGKGDLYLSKLVNTTFSKPVYQAGLNSPEWDGSACFIPNENKIIFASERKGGYGGKDLYSAEKLKDNTWGNIKNLGPSINSKYDEDAPFVTVDGKILFFSSNNNKSIGGYDVFRSDLKNGEWIEPYNLGPPINTTNDDKFFTVRGDGKVGYYSSYKQGGKGEQDIYKIEPGIPGMPVEMLEVTGFTSIDGKATGAQIEIVSTLKPNKFKTSLISDKTNGSFLTNLPAGDKYLVTVKADKFPPKIIELNTVGIDSFVVLNVFADFISSEYDKKITGLNQSDTLNSNEPFNLKAFEEKFGALKKEDLAFKVQIAAYKFFENFNYSNVLGFPKIIRQTGNDNITRFVMGHFATYNEALELLKKIKATGVLGDSFIVAVYKDQRKYLPELVKEKILD